MTRFVSTRAGIGLVERDIVAILDTPFPDVGAALEAGQSLTDLAASRVKEEVALDATKLLAPVRRPSKIWIVGFAYASHRTETNRTSVGAQPSPVLVAPSAVTGPFDRIRLPVIAPHRVDYEGELAVVIGKTCTNVREVHAHEYVAGYTVANDVSARDVQKGQREGWSANVGAAKSFDTFKPIGPALVTLDEFADPDDLLLQTWVDGELRQRARTSQLVWPVAYLVSFLSTLTTLCPGDVVLTGTPAGVGHTSGRFLASGSTVRVEVEGVGAIENSVVGPQERMGSGHE